MKPTRFSLGLFVSALIIAITNGQQKSTADVGKSASDTNSALIALFGTVVCQGRPITTNTLKNDMDYCSKVAQMDLPDGSNKKGNKQKTKNSKKTRKHALKCTTTCLWKLWGLTDDDKMSNATNSFLNQTFSDKATRTTIFREFEICTSMEANSKDTSDLKRFDTCTEHLHVIRCFKKVISEVCTGNSTVRAK